VSSVEPRRPRADVRPEAADPPENVSARSLARMVWAVSIPILFVEVGETIVEVTDTSFMARVGTAELAAIGLGGLAIELAVVPVIGVAEAMQIVIARRMGQRRERVVGGTFLRGLLLVLGLSLAAAIALRLLAGPIADLAAGSGPVADELEKFLTLAAWGVVPLALSLVYASLYVGLAAARVLVGAVVTLTATNVVVGYVLVFGALGFPELGIRGAAFAFVAAETVAFLYLTAHALLRLDRGRYGLAAGLGDTGTSSRALVRLGGPIAGQVAIETARWLAFFVIVARVSEEALAWSSIVYACYALFLIPTNAFAEAAYTLVSNAIGRGRADRIVWLMRRIIVSASAVTLPFVAVALAFPDVVVSLFTNEKAAVDGTLSTLVVVAASMLVVIPSEIWLAALFGTGDTDAAVAIEVITTSTMLAFAAVAALAFDLDLEFVWLSLPFASVVTLAAARGWVRSGRWTGRAV